MDINHLISQYGYAALIVGSMAEGETITLLGGVAAHQGLLKFPLVLIGASRLPPRIFLPLNIVGALVWALLFTTIGYLGGEVVGPWLHHLDAHLKHWIWLILAVVVVVAAHWWLRRRESKKKD